MYVKRIGYFSVVVLYDTLVSRFRSSSHIARTTDIDRVFAVDIPFEFAVVFWGGFRTIRNDPLFVFCWSVSSPL